MPTCPFGQIVYDAITRRNLSYGEAVRLINAAGAADGVKNATYDRTALKHWLRGTIPSNRTQRWIASALGLSPEELAKAAEKQRQQPSDIATATTWITDTNTSDAEIEQLAESTVRLAEAHTHTPARDVLAGVLRLHQQVQSLLKGGRQRLRQTRELLRIESNLLAHASLLLGDLGQDQTAIQYGNAALLYAQEAQADEAIVWSVMAKTARWQGRYADSAEMATHGFEISAVNFAISR